MIGRLPNTGCETCQSYITPQEREAVIADRMYNMQVLLEVEATTLLDQDGNLHCPFTTLATDGGDNDA